jgi:hypothetical protein
LPGLSFFCALPPVQASAELTPDNPVTRFYN